MKITKTLHVRTRDQWRAWLQRHHDTETEIWLVFDRKCTGRACIDYDAAVEEALCFGWIDGILIPQELHSVDHCRKDRPYPRQATGRGH